MRQSNFWGALVRRLREEKRMPQRRLAAQVGMNRSTIRNIEDGKNRDIVRIEIVLMHFGYELDALSQEAAAFCAGTPCKALTTQA